MSFSSQQSRLRTITKGDPGFMLKDGLVLAPRAGFQLLTECPREYKLIIAECINNGWLKPVATVYDYEQTFDLLKEN